MNMEEPAKNWQIAAVEKRLDMQEQLSRNIDSKLDRILEKQITSQHLEDRLKSQRLAFEASIREIQLKYDPYISNARWATRAIVLAALTVFGTIAIDLLRINKLL